MRLWKSWIVATKDFSIFRRNRYVFYSLIAIPLIFGIVVPSSLLLTVSSSKAALTALTTLINVETFYFVIVAAILPTVIGSYSFVGEKIEKSLEPLLATPTTDSELLLGKSLAAFLPSLGATFIGAGIFLFIVDAWSFANLGTFLLPNLEFAGVVGLVSPMGCILSVETCVLVSSRVSDVRAAQQLGGLVVLPLFVVVLLAVTEPVFSTFLGIAIIAGMLAMADVIMFYLSLATFKREEILTKWK